MLDSVLQDIAVIGAIGTFAFVFALFRFKGAEIVPAWWWLASAVVLGIVAFMGTGISWARGLAVILMGAALGLGLERFYVLWRSGELLPRRPHRERTDSEWADQRDWTEPAYHVVNLYVSGHGNLSADNPTFDFVVVVINGSVFDAELQQDIRGRIRVNGDELNQQPQFLQMEAESTSRLLKPGDDWTIRRNVQTTIRLRQHVLPAVADKLRADLRLEFGQLDIGLCPVRWVDGAVERGPRQRLRLSAYSYS